MRGPSLLRDLFDRPCTLVGMVHLAPLPGAPGWGGDMAAVLDAARRDAAALAEAGFDALMVENYHDTPFYPGRVPPETAASLTAAVAAVVDESGLPVGVNVLRNDGPTAVSIAVATGARFVRVNVHTGAMLGDQGPLLGEAYETVRLRTRLGAPVAILADVMVKHATPPPGIDVGQAARDAWHRGHADGLIASGLATGAATDPGRLDALRAAVPDAPLWIGSGLTAENAGELLARCDGAIVGSTLMRGGVAGAGVDPARAKAFMAAARPG